MRNPPNERLSNQPRTPADAGGQPEEGTGARLSPGKALAHAPERKCILSGEHGARSDLIRLALGPDGVVAPDVRARAAGRGAWIGVDRAALEAAQAKGKLRAALSRGFKTNAVSVPDDLPDRIEAALRQAALDRLGIEARAGTLVTGSERIEAAARAGDLRLLLHAADAGADGNAKLDQAWRVGGGAARGLVIPATRAILSSALGRQNAVHVGIVESAAATRVRQALSRWRAFIGRKAGLSAAAVDPPGARSSAGTVDEGLE